MKKMALSLIILSSLLTQIVKANSIEFMCKSKAKEIAAETYKNCVVENKQSQVDQIRKEYQAKLSELKSSYNSKLKQLSPKNSAAKINDTASEASSDMPAKKIKSAKVRTEKIDFSSPSSENTKDAAVASTRDSNDSTDTNNTITEIVELPAQQE